jgi:peroxiredoxin
MIRATSLFVVFVLGLIASASLQALEIGEKAPNFTATGVDGKEYSLAEIAKKSDLVVVAFTCNECPVAKGYEDRFIEFNKKYRDKKVTFIALNCNNETENLEAMKERAEEKGFNFVYAFDKTGKAAPAYDAKVTPELFVVKEGRVVYHGAFDDSQDEPKETYLVNAVDALLAGKSPEVTETRAFGCGIRAR